MPRTAPENEGLEELPFADPEPPAEAPRPIGGYRVAGDLEVRSKELEQDLVVLRERYKALEREVWAARRTLRRAKAARAISVGGLGATVATVLALVLHAADLGARPSLLLAIVILGYVLGAIAGMRWKNDDDDFPSAPQPRMD